MKLNWGKGIVLAFVAFIGFILYFVIIMSTHKRADHDLVVDDYYKAELGYQQEIDAQKRAKSLANPLELAQVENGLKVNFPSNQQSDKITGNVFLYRPSNKQLDFNLPISLSTSHLLIPDKRLLDGRWNITITWKYNGETYLHKEKLTIE